MAMGPLQSWLNESKQENEVTAEANVKSLD